MNHYNNLWVEKYRPKTIDEIVLDAETREHFEDIKEDVPHLLFYGPPGTGKSTLAKILVNDVLKCQYLYINASDENGIDTIRNKVVSFAQTRSIDSNKKVVILEEADGLTGDSLRMLRNVMEEYSSTTRFLLTANYLNKIIEPIQSRCTLFKIQPTLKGCADRCIDILKKENIDISQEGFKESFVKFLKERFPDFRRILNDLQRFSLSGTLIFNDANISNSYVSSLMEDFLINRKSSTEIRKMVIQNEKSFDNDYHNLMKNMFEYVYNNKNISEKHKKSIMLDIGEHMYRDNFVVDHEINFFCCLMAIENTISS